jgi:hypothetical protein
LETATSLPVAKNRVFLCIFILITPALDFNFQGYQEVQQESDRPQENYYQQENHDGALCKSGLVWVLIYPLHRPADKDRVRAS